MIQPPAQPQVRWSRRIGATLSTLVAIVVLVVGALVGTGATSPRIALAEGPVKATTTTTGGSTTETTSVTTTAETPPQNNVPPQAEVPGQTTSTSEATTTTSSIKPPVTTTSNQTTTSTTTTSNQTTTSTTTTAVPMAYPVHTGQTQRFTSSRWWFYQTLNYAAVPCSEKTGTGTLNAAYAQLAGRWLKVTIKNPTRFTFSRTIYVQVIAGFTGPCSQVLAGLAPPGTHSQAPLQLSPLALLELGIRDLGNTTTTAIDWQFLPPPRASN